MSAFQPTADAARRNSRRLATLALLASTALAGCAQNIDPVQPTFDRDAPRAEIPNQVTGREEAAPIIYVRMPSNALRPTLQSQVQAIPGSTAAPISTSAAPVGEALNMLLAGSRIPVVLDTEAGRRSVTVRNLSGPLNDVIPAMCSAAGVYCRYDGRALHVTVEEQFVVVLPPLQVIGDRRADEVYRPVAESLRRITGKEVTVDPQGRALTFTANTRTQATAERYLDHLRHSRSLLVFDVAIWEVSLDDRKESGIDWQRLLVSAGNVNLNLQTLVQGGGLPTATAPIVIGAAYSAARNINFDAVARLLRSQGRVQQVSRPQITLVSGTRTAFEVGGRQRFVSEVGAAALGGGGVGGAGASRTLVRTEDLQTGLRLALGGDWFEDSVFTNLDLEIVELVGFDEVRTEETTVRLPRTTNRTLQQTLRVRPGDMALMAGINSSRDETQGEGVAAINRMIPFARRADTAANRTELVIALRPRVVAFLAEGEQAPAGAAVQGAALQGAQPDGAVRGPMAEAQPNAGPGR